MIQKWKKWLINRYLPLWARQEMQEEIHSLKREKAALERRIDHLTAYINGLETGIRHQRKICIYTGEGRK